MQTLKQTQFYYKDNILSFKLFEISTPEMIRV